MAQLNPALPIRVAILDLYNGIENQGLRSLREMLHWCDGQFDGRRFTFDVFDVRAKAEVPGLDYDLYLSSGGPGSPFDGEGSLWEERYFNWLDDVWTHNTRPDVVKKHVLFICHSFQMMCRFFEIGEVTQRRSESFGIFRVYPTPEGQRDPILRALGDPFYAADFRRWQVIQPNHERLRTLGASILALERPRAHVKLERAVMAIRLSPEWVGVQFHPEADPEGMLIHFSKPERREEILAKHGAAQYQRLIHRLRDPGYLTRTHATVIPNFLKRGVASIGAAQAAVATG